MAAPAEPVKPVSQASRSSLAGTYSFCWRSARGTMKPSSPRRASSARKAATRPALSARSLDHRRSGNALRTSSHLTFSPPRAMQACACRVRPWSTSVALRRCRTQHEHFLMAISATNRFSDSHLCNAFVLPHCCHESHRFVNGFMPDLRGFHALPSVVYGTGARLCCTAVVEGMRCGIFRPASREGENQMVAVTYGTRRLAPASVAGYGGGQDKGFFHAAGQRDRSLANEAGRARPRALSPPAADRPRIARPFGRARRTICRSKAAGKHSLFPMQPPRYPAGAVLFCRASVAREHNSRNSCDRCK